MDIGWRELAPAILGFALCALVAVPVYLGLRAAIRRARARPMYCLACGSTTVPRARLPGSSLVEAALADLLALPGLAYSAWRIKARRMVCAACGSERIVPPDAPAAADDARRRVREPG